MARVTRLGVDYCCDVCRLRVSGHEIHPEPAVAEGGLCGSAEQISAGRAGGSASMADLSPGGRGNRRAEKERGGGSAERDWRCAAGWGGLGQIRAMAEGSSAA